jgi:hypothetical protein
LPLPHLNHESSQIGPCHHRELAHSEVVPILCTGIRFTAYNRLHSCHDPIRSTQLQHPEEPNGKWNSELCDSWRRFSNLGSRGFLRAHMWSYARSWFKRREPRILGSARTRQTTTIPMWCPIQAFSILNISLITIRQPNTLGSASIPIHHLDGSDHQLSMAKHINSIWL